MPSLVSITAILSIALFICGVVAGWSACNWWNER